MTIPAACGARLAGLGCNVALAIGLALIGNGVIVMLGWSGEADGRRVPSCQPPGWIIGAIWTALFAALGAARWLCARGRHEDGRHHARLITGLILACAAYPYYTLGFHSLVMGLLGSLATAGVAAIIAWQVAWQSRPAALLVSATALWCAFASVILIRTLALN